MAFRHSLPCLAGDGILGLQVATLQNTKLVSKAPGKPGLSF